MGRLEALVAHDHLLSFRVPSNLRTFKPFLVAVRDACDGYRQRTFSFCQSQTR